MLKIPDSMMYTVGHIALILQLSTLVFADQRPCPEKFYLNTENWCVRCTVCEQTDLTPITKTACQIDKDTVCIKKPHSIEIKFKSYKPDKFGQLKQVNSQEAFETSSLALNEEVAVKDNNLWKTITYAVIGVVGFLALVIVLVIVIGVRKRRQQQKGSGRGSQEQLYYRARVFSRDRLNTTEYQKSLSDLESQSPQFIRKKEIRRTFNPNSGPGESPFIDEVFEAEPEECKGLDCENKFRLGPLVVDFQDKFYTLGPIVEDNELSDDDLEGKVDV